MPSTLLLASALAGAATLAAGLWFARFVSVGLERDDWIGLLIRGLLAVAVVAGIVILLHELVGWRRLSRLGRLRRTYERMDDSIRDSGGPWLFGKDITLADVSVMPALVRMADLGREGDWADLPHVVKWYELIRAHAASAIFGS